MFGMKKFAMGGMIALLIFAPVSFVGAHGDSHAKDETHVEAVKTMSLAEMEQMVRLLQQLVAALLELKQLPQQAVAVTPVTTAAPVIPMASTTQEVKESEMDEHMEEHHEESDDDSKATLVIEVEPHFGKTHAHVRYTDKPEDMFFVNAAIDNEDGIVSEIAAHTGLTADVVRAALKYMQ